MSRKIRIGADELFLDPANPVEHGPRNQQIVRKSLELNGPGRSILIDEDNEVIVGNNVAERASEIGGLKLRIIDAAPDELIAVRRTDLSPKQKKGMKIADNAAGKARDHKYNRTVFDGYDADLIRMHLDEVEIRGIYPDGLEDGLDTPPDYLQDAPPAKPGKSSAATASGSPVTPQAHDRHPLAVVFSNAEHRRWLTVKDTLGAKTDKEITLRLMDFFEKEVEG